VWPEAATFARYLERLQRRLRLAVAAHSILLAAAASGVVLSASAISNSAPRSARWISGTVFLLAGGVVAVWRWRAISLRDVAARLEAQRQSPDNVIVMAEEILSGRARRPHAIVRDELLAAALRGIKDSPPHLVQPLAGISVLAAAAVAALVILAFALPGVRAQLESVSTSAATNRTVAVAPGDLRVVITPPSYTQRPAVVSLNPSSLLALEGSRVRFEAGSSSGPLTLIEPGSTMTRFRPDGEVLHAEFVAATSRPLVIRREGGDGGDRLLTLRVQPDGRPTVHLTRPAKDLVFPQPAGQIPIEIEARDDIELRSVTLHYTRVSGAGETFTFQEGEWPVELTRRDSTQWTARATLALERLALEDGDTVVYRAVARDGKPGADPATSDTFLIEVGRVAGVSATGFALPEDRDRQGLSQQMLIIKTERLHADRAKLAPEAVREQARLLAIEQRMVKAEFVFMTGGEVADEVEEAEQAHELAEGRLENSAQMELLTAIREMSRAEARLNDGNTEDALQFERAALRALQRAFDRRRYLLRTLPERTRIDPSRRLTGEMTTAKSSSEPHVDAPTDPQVATARGLLADLRAITHGDADVSLLASRLVAIDPQSESVQHAALRLAAARDASAWQAAVRAAQSALIELLKARLPTAPRLPLNRDVLRGRVAEELTRSSPK
jgi:hypothetical protein